MKQIVYQLIYNPTLNKILRNINKFFSPILPSKIKIPPSGTMTFHGSEGKKLKIKTNQTNFLTKILFWDGHEQFEYTSIFLRLIKKIDVFYDVGANIGYYSLIAAMENPTIKVVAFEPAHGPKHYLNENVRINHFTNIKVEDLAISNQAGSISFYEVKNKKYTYLQHNLAGEGNAGSKVSEENFICTDVQAVTFDEHFKQSNLSSLDLVKIDTEGTEHSILERAEFVLGEMKPIVICETLFNVIEPELEAIFKKFGYHFYNHIEGDQLKKAESIVRSEDDQVRNCFFVHPSKFHLIEEFVQ